MHFIKAFFILIITLVTYVRSECNTAGTSWGSDKSKVLEGFSVTCRTLTGTYPVASSARRCLSSGSNLKYDFTVQTLSSNVTRLNNKVCQAGYKEILECEKGGVVEMSGWRFKFRPLPGKC
ncbi:uncharacterized protein MELLADRAFT_106826 [Melampsora larici-populina 98AG31]|uniref:Secreted protein n=1 Tax=Melampsora larici-populina (strain 98AG31 / pathotype 3-4-7) TaxID=747676 RepID=F4RMR9_MELLP|nr:uncharacterized protein MELLADRAFT_106826 [Melampsora larici-populina 98AG31]EGG06159.1 secreted protein [Melampsora larici-populina 98AG31]